jgi:signal peptidase I
MSELEGSLSNVDLVALLRFLGGLGKTGDLVVWREPWLGHLSLSAGQLIGAAADGDYGLAALAFIGGTLSTGRFEFFEGSPGLPRNLPLHVDPIAALQRMQVEALLGASATAGYPRLDTVPRVNRGRVLFRLRALIFSVAQAAIMTAIFVVSMHAIFQNFRVEGTSMSPTFDAGQALIVNRAAYFHIPGSPLEWIVPSASQRSISYVFGGPRRGDVAVFRAPLQPDVDYLKRIIGLPGDSILIQQGSVIVNGQPLAEPYLSAATNYAFPPDGEPIIVPDDSYFVLGDNRADSLDSHAGWFVPASNLIGRAWFRYWPPSTIGVV